MLGRVHLFATPWTVAHHALLSLDSPGKNTGVGCHFQGSSRPKGLFGKWSLKEIFRTFLVMQGTWV